MPGNISEQSQLPAVVLEHSWLFAKAFPRPQWPQRIQSAMANGQVPIVAQPDDITIVVAGGTIPIPQNVYFPSWGFPPCRITCPIAPDDEHVKASYLIN